MRVNHFCAWARGGRGETRMVPAGSRREIAPGSLWLVENEKRDKEEDGEKRREMRFLYRQKRQGVGDRRQPCQGRRSSLSPAPYPAGPLRHSPCNQPFPPPFGSLYIPSHVGVGSFPHLSRCLLAVHQLVSASLTPSCSTAL